MKDQHLKKISSWLALAGLFVAVKMSAVSFNDVQFWTGTGTNRAALVIEWSVPEDFTGTSVPAPVADKSLVWGYRFNGAATGTQMLQAILGADARLYVVADETYGMFVEGIGYGLAGGLERGITDGVGTNYFTNNLLTTATVNVDAASPLNPGDLYWSGYWGPNWETWTEQDAAGGFQNAPDRGSDPYWMPNPTNSYAGRHGQWELAQAGLDGLNLTNGSWIGFSVAAGAWQASTAAPYNAHKHAPAEPDPGITALVKNFTGGRQVGQWRAQFVSCTNWYYSLERSTDLTSWDTVTNGIPGNSAGLSLADPAPPAAKAFYRVRADQP